jgi:hypothetical protein
MINYLFGFLNLYLGEPIAQALQNFAIECENFIGGGYTEEYVVLAYTLIMGVLLVFLVGLAIYGLAYILSSIWKGVKSIL